MAWLVGICCLWGCVREMHEAPCLSLLGVGVRSLTHWVPSVPVCSKTSKTSLELLLALSGVGPLVRHGLVFSLLPGHCTGQNVLECPSELTSGSRAERAWPPWDLRGMACVGEALHTWVTASHLPALSPVCQTRRGPAWDTQSSPTWHPLPSLGTPCPSPL